MATPIPTPIYHFTHAENLDQVLQRGALICKNETERSRIQYRSAAFESVQAQRHEYAVPVSARGSIHDYVPFYFNSKSPMLYTIKCGNLPNIQMQHLVFFRSTAQAVADAGKDFAFTDGHGIMSLSDYYDDLSELDQVPWQVVNAQYWKDHVDGKRLRQAEFLVHQQLEWSLVDNVGVYSEEMKNWVSSRLLAGRQNPPVTVRRGWFF